MKQDKTFEKLLNNPSFKKALKDLDFHSPTPVQQETLPLIVKGDDIICQSSTGSGKTLGFALPIAENIDLRKSLQAIVLVPTRELCEQVTEEFKKITKYTKINTLEVYGGVSINNQIRKVPHAHIIVATPGRLCDLMNRKVIDLSKIKVAVLDEADRMLDMGFIKDVEFILKKTPKQRQTLMFSATIPRMMEKLITRNMNKPKRVNIKEHVDTKLLKQYYYDVQTSKRLHLLVHLLKNEKELHALVFCATRRMVDVVAFNLNKNGVPAEAIHGGLTQNKRKQVISSFHDKETKILVASDIAARGLDIKLLTHVYNFDVPQSSEDYTHRVGRTARAGEEGIAITLLSEKDHRAFQEVLNNPKIKIERIETPEFELIEIVHRIPRSKQSRPASRNSSRGGPRGRPKGRFGPRGRSSSGGRPSGPRGRSSSPRGRSSNSKSPRRSSSSGPVRRRPF